MGQITNIYTEIFRLREMLDNAGIKYEFTDRGFDGAGFSWESYQIQVFQPHNHRKRIISVIEGDHTFGGKGNLLEIMGCLTPEEEKRDCVLGWLTAEEVFIRIEKAYKEAKDEESK